MEEVEDESDMDNMDQTPQNAFGSQRYLSDVLGEILTQQDDNDYTPDYQQDFYDEGHDMEDYQDSDTEQKELSWRIRRSRWKAKRYVMLQDVAKLTKQGDSQAIKKAQQVTERLLELHKENRGRYGGDDKPLQQAYNLWLHAIAKTSKSKDKGKQAERVLREMMSHCRPTVVSYTIVMTAYTHHPQDAERLLFELLERQQQSTDSSLKITSSVTTDAVLHAWAQQGTWEAAERARLILERLEQWQDSSSRENAIEANSQTYSIVMNAYSKLGAVDQVEAMLAKRIEDDERLGEKKVDVVMFNVAIKAWAVSRDERAGSRATALLRQLQDRRLQPDVSTYNSVLSAWSKSSGHMGAAIEAERILQEMITNAKKDKLAPRPNTVSYNSVLHAWSKSQQEMTLQRASGILEYMIRSQDPAPDIYSFTSVLNVVAKSTHHPDKAVQAKTLLDTLIRLSKQRQELKPSSIAFNIVLNSCAFSASFDKETQRQALQVAVSTFALLRSPQVECKPDDVTYGNLMKAIGNLLPGRSAQKTKLAMTVMRQCMEDGLVGEMVWQELPRCISRKALNNLLPARLVDIQETRPLELVDLPRQWRSNVATIAPRRGKEGKKSKTKEGTEKPARSSGQALRRPRGITESSWSGKDI
jgi:hypothetical protein